MNSPGAGVSLARADTLEREITDGHIRFTRPDDRVIDDHPRLPGATIEALRCANQQAIDASSWIISTDVMDYDMAIEGLLSLQQKRQSPEITTA